MLFYIIVLLKLLLVTSEQSQDNGYCEIDSKTCETTSMYKEQKYIFYDINPPEGFNLRRDVYMRLAIMLVETQKKGKMRDWSLVLPPWYKLYHWRKSISNVRPFPWSAFFDIESLKSYAPVVELHEVFAKTPAKTLEIDALYVINNYFTKFHEANTFEDQWEITDEYCDYNYEYWGYNNITAKETFCLKFQGKASTLLEILALHPKDTKIMFHYAEIPIHDYFGNKAFWDCRKSMKFSKKLISVARNYIENNLGCIANIIKCSTYISIHLRRRDFTRSHRNEIPNIPGAAKQIHQFITKNAPKIRKVFIATDTNAKEKKVLQTHLRDYNYETFYYEPTESEMKTYTEGGVAIIDQIICSHAAFFIGTFESTFTHRIEQEREILGFKSSTTFNRLCPDDGPCQKPSKWTIVD